MHPIGTFEIAGRFYCFKSAPHLTAGFDWHDAYIDIIDRFLYESTTRTRPAELPAYPLRFDNPEDGMDLLFEMGAYWEGALYFLYRIVSTREPLEKICQIEESCRVGHDNCSERERLFLTIWNSHGQLKWLKAFLIRRSNGFEIGSEGYTISSEKLHEAGVKHQNKDLLWLSSFVYQHEDEGVKYPNPYFGGGNSLHLTLIS